MSGKIIETQPDFFDDIRVTMTKEYKDSIERRFRGLYARYNEAEYIILEMHKKIEKLEAQVYKNA